MSAIPPAVTERTVLLDAPPEAWERILARYRDWAARHPAFVRRLGIASRVLTVAVAVLAVIALVLVPRLREAVVPGLWMLLALGTVTVLARTRTVSWRTIATVFALGVPWALGIALFTEWFAHLGGLTVSDDGSMIALASYIEEPGKVLPLLFVALVAPGRVRRFAAVDWALLGFATGAAFVLAEDGIRNLRRPGILDVFLGSDGLNFSLNPWASGWFESMDGSTVYPGHQVTSSLIAAAIGLGMAIWRARAGTGTAGRLALAVAPALACGLLALSDHAAYNAVVGLNRWPESGGEGFPLWMELLWLVGFKGRLTTVLAIAAFVACLAVDASRRDRAGRFGVVDPVAREVRRPELRGLPQWLREPAAALVLLARWSWSDVTLHADSHAVGGGSRIDAMRNGRLVGLLIREVRTDAMRVTTPGEEPATRRRFALVSLAVTVAVLALTAAYGLLMARAIGTSLSVEGDGPFFAGLLDTLGSWWNAIGPLGQFLVTVLAVGALAALGVGLATSLAAVGVGSWVLSHHEGVVTFARDPRAATREYLRNTSPGTFLWDLADFLLTFYPGATIGRALGRPLYFLRYDAATRRTITQLIDERQVWFTQRDAAAARLDALMPEGFTRADFTMGRFVKTLQRLTDAKVSSSTRKALEDAAVDLGRARGKLTQLSARIGEIGGERVLLRNGYIVPPQFRAAAGTPGQYQVDAVAFNRGRTQLIVPEYKGGSARIPSKPVLTLDGEYVLEGSAEWVRDRLLRDDRFISLLANDAKLWRKLRSGRLTIVSEAFFTDSATGPIVKTLADPVAITPDWVADLARRIQQLP